MSIIIDRDKRILYAIARYGAMDRKRIGWLCFSAIAVSSRDRVARRRLAALVKMGYIRRIMPDAPGCVTPVYCLTEMGREWLEADSCDPSMLGKPASLVQIKHLTHHLAVVDTHILVRQAVQSSPELTLERWINEHEIINYEDSDSDKQRTLFTVLSENPKIVCAFDSALHVRYRGQDAVYGLEQDRATSSAPHVCKHKMPGVAELAQTKRNREFFPDAEAKGFLTLLVTTKHNRRDRLCEELVRRDTLRPDLWRVAALPDLTPETFFFGSVWRTARQEPVSLLQVQPTPTPELSSSASPALPLLSSTTTVA